VPADEFDDAFNWFDAIEAIDVDEAPMCEPAYQVDVKREGVIGSDMELVGLFEQHISTQGTADNVVPQTGVESPAYTNINQQLWTSGPHLFGSTAAAAPASSGSVGGACEEDNQQSHDSSAAPSMQKLNNAAGLDKSARLGQYSCRPRVSRVNYSEIDDKVERVKQKRRESAQRSRARKNQYMKELETENAALRGQVAQLQQMVSQLQSLQYMNMGAPASTVTGC
jgi:hypothetical protein